MSAPASSMSSAIPTTERMPTVHSTRRPSIAAEYDRHVVSTAGVSVISCRYRTASADKQVASTRPRSTGRPTSRSRDVALAAISGGYDASLSLMPKPSTT